VTWDVATVAAAAGRRRRRCICCAAAMYILLVLPVDVLASSAAAAADGSFITWDDLSIPPAAAVQGAVGGGVKAASRGAPTRDLDTIVVSQDGTGHSRTVQGAVDMVPTGNRRRVKILVRHGVYR
jgi:pectinesterase